MKVLFKKKKLNFWLKLKTYKKNYKTKIKSWIFRVKNKYIFIINFKNRRIKKKLIK